MTLLVGSTATALLLMIAAFVAGLAGASSADVRAQTAADAAALAAVAESAPHGSGAPEAAARHFAEMNGAELLACTCEAGAAAVQVEVAFGDATADARAVLDAALLAPQGVLFAHRGIHPMLGPAVERLLAAAGGDVWVTSGFRSTSEQAALWDAALERHGSAEEADDWVAPPGHSMHEKGLAVDLGGDLASAARLVRRLGLPLYRPLANEPWHFELTGSRG